MERLDVHVAKNGYTRSYAAKLIKAGRVRVDKVVQRRPSFLVGENNKVDIEDFTPTTVSAKAEDIPLSILYEDDDLLIVNKNRGMVVHPSKGHSSGTLVNALLGRLEHNASTLSSIGGEIRPGIVHRLDKDTSGLLLVAKNDSAHLALSEQIEQHEVTRIYYALVAGNLEHSGTIKTNIGRSKNNRLKMAVVPAPKGKHAITHYEPLKNFKKYCLVKVQLETGRTHQVRVHMAYIGRPVAGDPVYGRGEKSLGGQVLHAKKIAFRHPRTDKYMEFESELPEYFKQALLFADK